MPFSVSARRLQGSPFLRGSRFWVCALLLPAAAVLVSPASAQTTLFETNFDSLTSGATQPFPGAAGQDGWYRQISFGTGFGEIQSAVANPGKALHEFSPAANPTGQQSQDARNLTQIAASTINTLTLSFDFQARSSDLSTINPYTGFLNVTGVEGGTVLGVNLGGGNGVAKTTTGINVGLITFNGTNNNIPVTLTAGQHLAWNSWHSVSITGNLQTNQYVSLTVDGVTQSLTGIVLPDYFVGGVGFRPLTLRDVETNVTANNTTFAGNATNDDVYWDNIKVSYFAAAAGAPEPASLAFALAGGGPILLGLARGRRILRRRTAQK